MRSQMRHLNLAPYLLIIPVVWDIGDFFWGVRLRVCIRSVPSAQVEMRRVRTAAP